MSMIQSSKSSNVRALPRAGMLKFRVDRRTYSGIALVSLHLHEVIGHHNITES